MLDIHEEARRIASTGSEVQPSHPSDTGVSTGVGTAAPPLDPAVHTTSAPLAPSGAEAQPKTTEAPIVP